MINVNAFYGFNGGCYKIYKTFDYEIPSRDMVSKLLLHDVLSHYHTYY